MIVPHPENQFASVLRGSFRKWLAKDTKRVKAFESLSNDMLEMIQICFGELTSYGPGPAYTWYVRNHMRFKVRNDELRIGMNMVQEFLGDYAHGRLERTEAEKKTGTTTNRPNRTQPPNRVPVNGHPKI